MVKRKDPGMAVRGVGWSVSRAETDESGGALTCQGVLGPETTVCERIELVQSNAGGGREGPTRRPALPCQER